MKLRTADSFNALGCVHRRPLMGNSAVRGKKRRRGVPAAASGKKRLTTGDTGDHRGTIFHPEPSEADVHPASKVPRCAALRCPT